MALQKYIDDYTGCEPDEDGDYVRHEDVIALLETIAKEIKEQDSIAAKTSSYATAESGAIVEKYLHEEEDNIIQHLITG